MQLSRYTDYALRVLIQVAVNSDRRLTLADIATHNEISREHLRKVVHALGRLGYLRTFRGKRGGLELGMPANQIRVSEVVTAMEPRTPPVECNRPPCVMASACSLKRVFAKAEDAFYQELSQHTLSDLLGQRGMRSLARVAVS